MGKSHGRGTADGTSGDDPHRWAACGKARKWTTSTFPGNARGCPVLPIKAAVRKAEAQQRRSLDTGEVAAVTVELIASDLAAPDALPERSTRTMRQSARLGSPLP